MHDIFWKMKKCLMRINRIKKQVNKNIELNDTNLFCSHL